VRLGAKRVPGEQPAKQGRAGRHFRQHLIAERVQPQDRRVRGDRAIVGERHVDVASGKLARDERHFARRRVHDQADVRLLGVDVGDRMDAQQHVGHGGHLVGRQRPGADAQQQQKRDGECDQPQPPKGDRAHAVGSVEDEIHSGRLLVLRGAPVA
jgi:hypothetical protein